MTVGLLLTAFGLGLRHGIDWDHIAAIADLSSTAESRRRGFVLSFLYAVGHGVVVMALGVAAILFGAALPEGADVWMARVVGITLIALGTWVLVELLRKGRDFRLRSRWILVIGGTFAGLRRVRHATARRRLTIEHEHEHPHPTIEAEFDTAHTGPHAHDHAHNNSDDAADEVSTTSSDSIHRGLVAEDLVADGLVAEDLVAEGLVAERAPGDSAIAADTMTESVTNGRLRRQIGHGRWPGRSHSHSLRLGYSHSHAHRHETDLTDSVTDGGTGNGTAAGIGLLHGIGFESPTQIAVFVASTSIVGAWAGLGLLVAWVLGLIIANSALAGLAAYGLLGAERNFVIYATVAVIVGVVSIVFGVVAFTGADVLPALN